MKTTWLERGETDMAVWRDQATYDEVLQRLREDLQDQAGKGPLAPEVQREALHRLLAYFSLDQQERSPTAIVTSALAEKFHAHVLALMAMIDGQQLEGISQVNPEVRHALLAYQAPQLHSAVSIDAIDARQSLIRLSYFVHGAAPTETFLIDGKPVTPLHAKYRGCRYFQRSMCQQRIVWLPVQAHSSSLEARIDGQSTPIFIGCAPFTATRLALLSLPSPACAGLVTIARARLGQGRAPRAPRSLSWASCKSTAVRTLAALPWVRRRFAHAWVFIDRQEEADDNAEHLYRWVRDNHPDINAWFLLDPHSQDWARLREEGFRLMPPGLRRKLLVLNSAHIISSHPDASDGGLSVVQYGDAMRWKFSFLRHGVMANDQSHWLNSLTIDRLVTSSPAAHHAVVDDGSPYVQTTKETQRTGMPRMDALLRLAAFTPVSQVESLLIFPTWRSNLRDFETSDFARCWISLLRNDRVRELAQKHNLRLTLMLHPNARQFSEHFFEQTGIRPALKTKGGIQWQLAHARLLITDYSSLSFDMAQLRRPVLYYQFDRDEFFGGNHTLRQGHFDYERDGFGPVACDESSLIQGLERALSSGPEVQEPYLRRMRETMPETASTFCQRVFQSICVLDRVALAVPEIVPAEPAPEFWRDPASYETPLRALRDAVQVITTPGEKLLREAQLALLRQLRTYFDTDLRERAPTVALTADRAGAFHDHVRALMEAVDPETLLSLEQTPQEVLHALLSYQSPQLHSAISLDAFDQRQGLVRLSYFVHGKAPAESFQIDGKEIPVSFAKYRRCHFFHRTLLRQRLVWLAVSPQAQGLVARLDGEVIPVFLRAAPFSQTPNVAKQLAAPDSNSLLDQMRSQLTAGKFRPGNQGVAAADWKVLLMRRLAALPWIKRRFERAWVFVDRDSEADDNAEHLYRWVQKNHPEINAWFLLRRDSPDWPRLQAEGFRLCQPDSLSRKLLVLNSEHIISSHNEFEYGGMEPDKYGPDLRFRFSFVPHGISKDDVSHWLGRRGFDLFITTSPAEHESIVGDDTGYGFTQREVRYAGLPRRDRLFQLAHDPEAPTPDTLLVMPTWRASLLDERLQLQSGKSRFERIAASDYVQYWRSLMRNEVLQELVQSRGLRLAFMAHPLAAPFIKAFDFPAHVEVLTKADTSFLPLLQRSFALITDYTSVAFEMAFLRRAVFYYQFDREHFYGGGHNLRPGYFDYDRDGFGPCSTTETDLIAQLQEFMSQNRKPADRYLRRMEQAMPDCDDRACERVFAEIQSLNRPFGTAPFHLLNKPMSPR